MVDLPSQRAHDKLWQQFFQEAIHWSLSHDVKGKPGDVLWHAGRVAIEMHVHARMLHENPKVDLEEACETLNCNEDMLFMFIDPNWVISRITGDFWNEEEQTG